jgi:hypothetical protein
MEMDGFTEGLHIHQMFVAFVEIALGETYTHRE